MGSAGYLYAAPKGFHLHPSPMFGVNLFDSHGAELRHVDMEIQTPEHLL
jgi:hypothetical protein